MAQVFKMAVGNVVVVNIKLTMRDGTVDKLFKFTLTAVRRNQSDLEQRPDETIKEFLLANVTDWADQRLVLQENNEPAAFSRDAFDFMLGQPGALGVIWASYQRDCASKEKN